MIANVIQVLLLLLFVLVSLPVPALHISADRENARTADQLYRRHCIACHGADGRAKTSKGKFSHARDLSDAQWQDEVSDERIFNSILNGRNVRGNMPAFANKLNEKDVNSLVEFVRRLKGSQQQ